MKMKTKLFLILLEKQNLILLLLSLHPTANRDIIAITVEQNVLLNIKEAPHENIV